MTAVLIGQLLGLGFACGLNLYITVAAIGLLARIGFLDALPPGLSGLQGLIVIISAVALYLVEAVVDKVRHADSLWDTVHTFIRPPAAALLGLGALWGMPLGVRIAGAALAFLVALAAHGTKAGLRVALNTGSVPRSSARISLAEDVMAAAFAVAALEYPGTALAAGGAVLLFVLLFGQRFWRAFVLGMRCLLAWFRAFFAPARWREADEIPSSVRAALGPHPLGTAPPRGARAALNGVRTVGAFRNGWLVITAAGPVFLYWTLAGVRRYELPPAEEARAERGVWADVLRVVSGAGTYSLYLLKDGPTADLALQELELVTS